MPTRVLNEIASRHGTPTYAYDLARVRTQVAKLRSHLPAEVEILYSLKANASLGLSGVLAGCGLGADVASAGELVTALAAGFPPERIFLTGPDKSPPVLAELALHPAIVVSLDSVSELELLAGQESRRQAILRLRPDFCSHASCSTGPDARFGLTFDELPHCRALVRTSGIEVIGFHVFSGSQVLSEDGVLAHLRDGLDLCLRAGKSLGITPRIIDIGGGLGIPYAAADRELDLARIGAELRPLVARAAPARLVIELGRYLVAQAGWYLTTVLGAQTHRGRRAVVVDGGVHQRGDLCGLGLRQKGVPPVPLQSRPGDLTPTDVLGALSLPSDVLVEASLLPPLLPGDVLAFPNAGAYGLHASPWSFHGHGAPAEVAFDGDRIVVLRPRQPVRAVLNGQQLAPVT